MHSGSFLTKSGAESLRECLVYRFSNKYIERLYLKSILTQKCMKDESTIKYLLCIMNDKNRKIFYPDSKYFPITK